MAQHVQSVGKPVLLTVHVSPQEWAAIQNFRGCGHTYLRYMHSTLLLLDGAVSMNPHDPFLNDCKFNMDCVDELIEAFVPDDPEPIGKE